MEAHVIKWLMEEDPSAAYLAKRDLLFEDDYSLRKQMEKEGYCSFLLSKRDPVTGMWGEGIYSPKWISTHYTLLELMDLGIDGSIPEFTKSAELLLHSMWFNKGWVRKDRQQDVCVAAMILRIALHAGITHVKLDEIIGYLINSVLSDGGWNCSMKTGSHVSSFHTTLSVLEAIEDYKRAGREYRKEEFLSLRKDAEEYLLKRQLLKRLSTGEDVKKAFSYISYPCRWKYDVLRALYYFAKSGHPYDKRMEYALSILKSKELRDGTYPSQNRHSGLLHGQIEKTGKPSRYNTIRALYVLERYTK